jgi:RNA polymerase sigma factor (sigma-70 family)
MQTPADDPVWLQLAPVLDEAMARLGPMDRTVVLLRFFENQSLKEVGCTLGISEDTAQKRVARAIIKLRGLLLERGVPVSTANMTATIST